MLNRLTCLLSNARRLAFTILILFSSLIYADSLSNNIPDISAKFLGKPYQLHPLDEKILYRLDVFDCETYVDTVLALAFSKTAHDVEKNMLAIRYANNIPNYYTRNHFPDSDWIPNNIKKGYIKYSKVNTDTISMVDDKQAFFNDPTIKNPRVTLPYIPSDKLPQVINQIPNGSIIFIVKPTFLLISHMGFGIWKNNTLYLRAASSYLNKVADIPLLLYIQHDKDIKGISVLIAT